MFTFATTVLALATVFLQLSFVFAAPYDVVTIPSGSYEEPVVGIWKAPEQSTDENHELKLKLSHALDDDSALTLIVDWENDALHLAVDGAVTTEVASVNLNSDVDTAFHQSEMGKVVGVICDDFNCDVYVRNALYKYVIAVQSEINGISVDTDTATTENQWKSVLTVERKAEYDFLHEMNTANRNIRHELVSENIYHVEFQCAIPEGVPNPVIADSKALYFVRWQSVLPWYARLDRFSQVEKGSFVVRIEDLSADKHSLDLSDEFNKAFAANSKGAMDSFVPHPLEAATCKVVSAKQSAFEVTFPVATPNNKQDTDDNDVNPTNGGDSVNPTDDDSNAENAVSGNKHSAANANPNANDANSDNANANSDNTNTDNAEDNGNGNNANADDNSDVNGNADANKEDSGNEDNGGTADAGIPQPPAIPATDDTNNGDDNGGDNNDANEDSDDNASDAGDNNGGSVQPSGNQPPNGGVPTVVKLPNYPIAAIADFSQVPAAATVSGSVPKQQQTGIQMTLTVTDSAVASAGNGGVVTKQLNYAFMLDWNIAKIADTLTASQKKIVASVALSGPKRFQSLPRTASMLCSKNACNLLVRNALFENVIATGNEDIVAAEITVAGNTQSTVQLETKAVEQFVREYANVVKPVSDEINNDFITRYSVACEVNMNTVPNSNAVTAAKSVNLNDNLFWWQLFTPANVRVSHFSKLKISNDGDSNTYASFTADIEKPKPSQSVISRWDFATAANNLFATGSRVEDTFPEWMQKCKVKATPRPIARFGAQKAATGKGTNPAPPAAATQPPAAAQKSKQGDVRKPADGSSEHNSGSKSKEAKTWRAVAIVFIVLFGVCVPAVAYVVYRKTKLHEHVSFMSSYS